MATENDASVNQSINQSTNQSILFSPERTAGSIHRGLPMWKLPQSPIIEPEFSEEDKQLIGQLKTVVLNHLNDPSIITSTNPSKLRHPDFESKDPIFESINWRDIYHAHSHKTTIKPSTPDPRLQPAYQATYQSVGPKLADWPDYRWHQFLVGRKRSVKKASIMLLDYVSWYVNFGVDDLIKQDACPFSDAVEQFYPERFHGVALNGQPLLIGCAGSINVDAYLARALPLEAAYVTQAYKSEVCQRACIDASALCGHRHSMFTNIQDLANFTYGHRVGVPWVKKCALIASAFYPESLAVSIVPNMPSWFSMLWSLLSTFLDERTQSKVEFPGGNWKQRLQHFVSADNLPREWGGSCTKCNQSINQSSPQSASQNPSSVADGCLPYCVKYDRQALMDEQIKQVVELERDQAEQTMTIHARQSIDLPFEITKELVPHLNNGSVIDGSDIIQLTLWWSLSVLNKDVELSIHWKQQGSTGDVLIVAPQKLSADSTVHRGCHTFTVTTEHDLGVASIRVNNHYSMFSSKQITIKAGLTKTKNN